LSHLFAPVSSWRAHEVIVLWLGSLFGAVLGAVAGGLSAFLYVQAFPSDEPLEDIGVAVVGMLLGAFIGAILVAWVALRVAKIPRAGVSALACVLLMTAFAALTAWVGADLIPSIGINFRHALFIGSLLSSLVTYGFVTRRSEDEILGQPA
jgi:hypothetical protein